MDYETIDAMLTNIQDHEGQMENWESDLISNVIDFFEEKGFLTEPQQEKVLEIYERII